MIDCDHDHQPRGQLLYAELVGDRLQCVAVVDGDQLAEIDEPVYFSPEMEPRGDVDKPYCIARQAALVGLSLTLSPATVGAVPVKIRAGDLRSRVDRGSWSWSWQHSDPLLARALDRLGDGYGVEKRTVNHIVDVETEKVQERMAEAASRERFWHSRGDLRTMGRGVPPQYRPGWKPGDLEWSTHAGKVLDVR